MSGCQVPAPGTPPLVTFGGSPPAEAVVGTDSEQPRSRPTGLALLLGLRPGAGSNQPASP